MRKRWQRFRRGKEEEKALRRLDKVSVFVRDTQKLEEVEVNGPVDYAEKVLQIKPFPYQASLLEDRSKRIVACMGRQTGKTTAIAAKAIYFADTNPKMTVLIMSPSMRQSMIMFDRIVTLVYSAGFLRNKIVRITRTLIQFDNESKIIALPCSQNLLRGYTAQVVICDEAAFMPEQVITQVIFPMLSTTDGTAIFLSTPWGRNHFFYRAFANPAYSVYKIRSRQCPLIKPEFLAEMKMNMTQNAYLMEYDAEFVEASNCYFPQDLIRKSVELAQTLNIELYASLEANFPTGDYFAGVDFGKIEDYSVLAVLKRECDLLKLVHLYQFPLETPYTNVIGHLVRANQKFAFRSVLVDETGVGEPVLEEIRNQGIRNAEGMKFTVETKEEMLSSLKIIMEQNRLAIPYNLQLCTQINEQQCEYAKSGHLQFSHPINSHDDMLWSLALAVYTSTQAPPPGRGAVILSH